MLKPRVYKHETRKGHWVVDPPGYPTRHNKTMRGYITWQMNGGKVIKGYKEAMEHANCVFKESRWAIYGKRAGMVC